MIPLKTKEEIILIRKAGKILAEIINKIKKQIRPGITTAQIDTFARDLIIDSGGYPAFKGYRGFPSNICVSVNEEIVHGIPTDDRILRNGDIVSVDVGIKLGDYFADAAFTMPIGNINGNIAKLVDVARKALYTGIKRAKVNNYLSDISYSIQKIVESNGFSVVRDFVGHGIGKMMHEEPEIPNFGRPKMGPRLKVGMVLAIEPMVNMGTWEVEILGNGWTAVTKDRKPSAHFEHTIAITEIGPEILTG
jgi:methionyl aminopeptidase